MSAEKSRSSSLSGVNLDMISSLEYRFWLKKSLLLEIVLQQKRGVFH